MSYVICDVNEPDCLHCETINVPVIIKNAGLPKLATQETIEEEKTKITHKQSVQ